MDDKMDSTSALIDLEAAVSMVSLDVTNVSNDVFLTDDLLPPPPSALLVGTDSTMSIMESLPSSSQTEAASSFEFGEDPFLGRQKLSAVVLKPLDPMWDSTARQETPEPAIHPAPPAAQPPQRYHHQAKYDQQFMDDLLFLSSHSPSPSTMSDPFPMHPEGGRKRSSVSESHDHPHPGEVDSSVDGQKLSSSASGGGGREHKSHWPIRRSSHRAKHASMEDKKTPSPHGSHHFHDLIHYLRKFSHSGSHKEIHVDECKEATEDAPSSGKHHRWAHRNSVGSRPTSSSNDSAEFRVRAHSTGGGGGVRPKVRPPGTCQAVYSIYDNIVKEGKHNMKTRETPPFFHHSISIVFARCPHPI